MGVVVASAGESDSGRAYGAARSALAGLAGALLYGGWAYYVITSTAQSSHEPRH